LVDSYQYVNTSIPSLSVHCFVFGTLLSVTVEHCLCVCLYFCLSVCPSCKLGTEKVRLWPRPFCLFRQLRSFSYVCIQISVRIELPVVGTEALNIWSISDCIVPRKCHTVEHSVTSTHIRLGYVTFFPYLQCSRTWILRILYKKFRMTIVGNRMLTVCLKRTCALCRWNHNKSIFLFTDFDCILPGTRRSRVKTYIKISSFCVSVYW
jgi:hypothetical protein